MAGKGGSGNKYQWVEKQIDRNLKEVSKTENISNKDMNIMELWNKTVLELKQEKLTDASVRLDCVSICSTFLDRYTSLILKKELEAELLLHLKMLLNTNCLSPKDYTYMVTSFKDGLRFHQTPELSHHSPKSEPSPINNSQKLLPGESSPALAQGVDEESS